MAAAYKSVLLVEDYEQDETLFLLAVRRAELRNPVLILRSAEEALAYLERIQIYVDTARHLVPGVLILDLTLPGKDGFAVLEWLKTQPKLNDILVVVVTGSLDPAVWERVYKSGAHSFFRKPITPEDLQGLVATFTDKWMTP